MAEEVLGMLSAIISKKTVNARRTEIPNDIFSPASGGRQKLIIMSMDNMTQGNTIFIM
jgi:hypothetical protein